MADDALILHRWETNVLGCLERLADEAPVSEHRLFIALGAHWEVLPVLDRLAAKGQVTGAPTGRFRPEEGRPIREWWLTDHGRRRLGLLPPLVDGRRSRLSPLAG